MISFNNFFWSALFGGVIGGVLGAMLTLKIYGEQGREQAEPPTPPNMGKEPVEDDYIPEL